MFAMITAIQSDGLTLGEIIQNVPHDAPAAVVYTLILIFIGFIVYGSRSRSS